MEKLDKAWGAHLMLFNRRRLFASWAGLAIAVLVMFIEVEFLLGILNSQAMIASLANGELVIMNAARTNLHNWTELDPVRLSQAAAREDVAQVVPVYQGMMGLRDPADNAVRRILVLAFAPQDNPLAIGDPAAIRAALETPDSVLFDRSSRPIYGDAMRRETLELDGDTYRMGGVVEIGPDIVNDGAVVMSEGSWLARTPRARPIMAVIRLKPGANVAAAEAQLRAVLPRDTVVLTPGQVWWREARFTLRAAPIGILFGIGLIAGLVIGAITCFQILYNQMADQAKQYATLKAMGFAPRFLRRIVLEQALLLGWGGFGIGIVAAWLVLLELARRTALALHVGWGSALAILALVVLVCIGSGLLALRRMTATDPAELY